MSDQHKKTLAAPFLLNALPALDAKAFAVSGIAVERGATLKIQHVAQQSTDAGAFP